MEKQKSKLIADIRKMYLKLPFQYFLILFFSDSELDVMSLDRLKQLYEKLQKFLC